MKQKNSILWVIGGALSACLSAYLLIQCFVLLHYHDFRYGIISAGSGTLFLLGYIVCMYRFLRKQPVWNSEDFALVWKRFQKGNVLQIFLSGCVGTGFAVYLGRYTGKSGILFTGIFSLLLIIMAILIFRFRQSRKLLFNQQQYRDTILNIASSLHDGSDSDKSGIGSYVFLKISNTARYWRDLYAALIFAVAFLPLSIVMTRHDRKWFLLILVIFLALSLCINIGGGRLSLDSSLIWQKSLLSGNAAEIFRALTLYCDSCTRRWQFPDPTVQMYGVLALSYMDHPEEALTLLRCIHVKRRFLDAYFYYNEALLLKQLNRKDELAAVLEKLKEALPKAPKQIRQRAEEYYYLLTSMLNGNYEPVLQLKNKTAPNLLTQRIWEHLIHEAENTCKEL